MAHTWESTNNRNPFECITIVKYIYRNKEHKNNEVSEPRGKCVLNSIWEKKRTCPRPRSRKGIAREYLECRAWCNVRKQGGLAPGQQAIMARGNPWLNGGFSIIVSNLISLIPQQGAGTFLTQLHFPLGHFLLLIDSLSNVLDPKGLLHLDTVSSDLLVHLSIIGTWMLTFNSPLNRGGRILPGNVVTFLPFSTRCTSPNE